MYKILVDGKTFCDSRIDDLAIINPVVNLEVNSAGSMSFTIPPEHPFYDAIKRRKSVISVYRDDAKDPIFQGICTEETIDFYKQKKIECEGELTYLNDSIQRQAKYQDKTVLQLLTEYIAIHNSQVEESKRFEIGSVTVADDYIYCFTNMETTLECIKGDLVDDLGGYIRIRYKDGHKYIDYLADSPKTALQTIELGKNLLSYNSNINDTEIVTRVIPLGSKIDNPEFEELEQRLDIKSVNDGLDYLQSDAAIEELGIISQVIIFDNVTVPSILKQKGQVYLNEIQFENVVIEVGAVDLGYLTDKFDKFELLDYIHVISAPHGMDKWFTLTEMKLNLNQPDKDTFTLGKTKTLSLSAQSNNQSAEITKVANETPTASYMNQAIKQATSILSGAEGGFIKIQTDEDGKPYEILIMDTDDVATAQKVWRWNQNGFGYSANGYDGDYALAMTMNGEIVADFITAGTMRADRISGGIFRVGGELNRNGVIEIYDENGVKCGSISSGGLAIYSPTTQTQTIISPATGLAVIDSDGNDYIGANFRYDFRGTIPSISLKPQFTYKDGTPYTGITKQPCKIRASIKCFDEDKKVATIYDSKTDPSTYMTDYRWKIEYQHSTEGLNEEPNWNPYNITFSFSQSGTIAGLPIYIFEPKIVAKELRVIQLPEKFKDRDIAVTIDVNYKNPYELSNNIFSYCYVDLEQPKCKEGLSMITDYYPTLYPVDLILSNNTPQGNGKDSPYINPNTYVDDDKREIFGTSFDFPKEFYSYDASYTYDKTLGILTVEAWAIGRWSKKHSNMEMNYFNDFISMNEFMDVRVMVTT